MAKTKYVDLEAVRHFMYLIQMAQEDVKAYTKSLHEVNNNGIFCRECGAINPEHGFYPLMSSVFDSNGSSVFISHLICNDCHAKPISKNNLLRYMENGFKARGK